MIKHVITDCDGVLTDGKYYCSKDGRQFVSYNANDSLAVKIAKELGIECIMISSTSQPEIHKIRAEELGVKFIWSRKVGKVEVVRGLGVNLDEIAYIGDSVDDIPVFEMVKYSFTPSNSLWMVKDKAPHILTIESGNGCLLELVMTIKENRKYWGEKSVI